jgi:hypothetical protein
MTTTTDPRFDRYRTAYLAIAKEAHYRPLAPGDGFGSIYLLEEELRDRAGLQHEARQYATEFLAQDEAMEYSHGCPNFVTNRAFCYVIEAAHALCAGSTRLHWPLTCSRWLCRRSTES